jgi:hypothetical protein
VRLDLLALLSSAALLSSPVLIGPLDLLDSTRVARVVIGYGDVGELRSCGRSARLA